MIRELTPFVLLLLVFLLAGMMLGVLGYSFLTPHRVSWDNCAFDTYTGTGNNQIQQIIEIRCKDPANKCRFTLEKTGRKSLDMFYICPKGADQ